MKVHLSRNADASCIEGFIQGRWRPVLRWTRKNWPRDDAHYRKMEQWVDILTTGCHDSGTKIEFIFD